MKNIIKKQMLIAIPKKPLPLEEIKSSNKNGQKQHYSGKEKVIVIFLYAMIFITVISFFIASFFAYLDNPYSNKMFQIFSASSSALIGYFFGANKIVENE